MHDVNIYANDALDWKFENLQKSRKKSQNIFKVTSRYFMDTYKNNKM